MIKTERKTGLSALNLKKWMMQIAISHMTHYQSDLVYDFETIDKIKEEGEAKAYSWQLRDAGTDFVRINIDETEAFVTACREYNDYEFVITYSKADGFTITEAMKI